MEVAFFPKDGKIAVYAGTYGPAPDYKGQGVLEMAADGGHITFHRQTPALLRDLGRAISEAAVTLERELDETESAMAIDEFVDEQLLAPVLGDPGA